jgi:hypothetical protein
VRVSNANFNLIKRRENDKVIWKVKGKKMYGRGKGIDPCIISFGTRQRQIIVNSNKQNHSSS